MKIEKIKEVKFYIAIHLNENTTYLNEKQMIKAGIEAHYNYDLRILVIQMRNRPAVLVPSDNIPQMIPYSSEGWWDMIPKEPSVESQAFKSKGKPPKNAASPASA
jgi:hypothetical protein